jgi:AcrR family transcriptional regulator
MSLWRKLCQTLSVQDPRVARTRERALGVARSLLIGEGIDAVTHLRVAEAGGGGRRTLYRHWPERRDLLRDTLAHSEVPHAVVTGDVRVDLIAHLHALRMALQHSPLATIVCTLAERSTLDPDLGALRVQLAQRGCEPGRAIVRRAIKAGALAKDTNVDTMLAELEGPLFYCSILHGTTYPAAHIEPLVDRLVARPPVRRPSTRPHSTPPPNVPRPSSSKLPSRHLG